MVTPLVSKEWGHTVLVNRGWVPAEWKSDAKLWPLGCPTGQVLPLRLELSGTDVFWEAYLPHTNMVPVCIAVLLEIC